MRADEMSDGFEAFIRAARGRIEGVGAEQYDRGDHQRFEGLPVRVLAAELQEELTDVAVWAYELWWKVGRIAEAMSGAISLSEIASEYVANLHAGRP